MRTNRITWWWVVASIIALLAYLPTGCAVLEEDEGVEASTEVAPLHHLRNSAPGLSDQAIDELEAAGVFQYVGDFAPIASTDVGDGWTKHTFDPANGDGPICIAGTPYSVFTREGNPSRLLVLLQGGGACWQDFYNCNILAEDQEPPFARSGIWDFDERGNPFADYSIVYLPYCDGSTFVGDSTVADPNFPFGPFRFHRGLRNVTAAMDVAAEVFPHPSRITVAGSSAGGVGAAVFTPFLARLAWGNTAKLTVFNDAGPIALNLDDVAGVEARALDWQYGQFFPASCTECDDLGQGTAIVDWRLDNDAAIREAFYETDGDATNRFFMSVPTQEAYRELILSVHGELNAAYPDRYKRFIVSGDSSHTALQGPRFYATTADGVPLNEWTDDFLVPRPFWVDLVEDFVPLP